MTSLTVVLPLPPNMANARYQGHWRSKKRKRDQYFEQANLYYCATKQPEWSLYDRGVSRNAQLALRFTLCLGAEMDHDNALARCKWPVDWLVGAGFLVADSPKFCRMSIPEQVITRDKSKQRVEITITYEDVEDSVFTDLQDYGAKEP